MTDLEEALRSQLAALPEPELRVPEDLLPNLRRRQARRRILAPAALVSIVVAVLLAVPLSLGATHRSGRHSDTVAEPHDRATMTLTLHPLDGAALEPGTRAAALDALRTRLRNAHLTGNVQPGSAPDTLQITGLARPLPASLLSVGSLTLRQVFAVAGGDDKPLVIGSPSSAAPRSPSQCTGLSQIGTADMPSPQALCLYQSVRCSSYSSDAAGEIANIWSVSCSRDHDFKYLLRPAALDGKDIRAASALEVSTAPELWQVDLAFTVEGQRRFTDLTRSAVADTVPQNQVAMVVDGVVQAAPVTESVIAGDAAITGNYTRVEAKQLAAVLAAGPLPARVEISSSTTGK